MLLLHQISPALTKRISFCIVSPCLAALLSGRRMIKRRPCKRVCHRMRNYLNPGIATYYSSTFKPQLVLNSAEDAYTSYQTGSLWAAWIHCKTNRRHHWFQSCGPHSTCLAISRCIETTKIDKNRGDTSYVMIWWARIRKQLAALAVV